MNCTIITMPRREAIQKLKAYRRRSHKDAEAAYHLARQGFEALADGARLIDVVDAIRAGGFDEKMRPRLAIARADRLEVHFAWRSYEHVARFRTDRNNAAWCGPSLNIEINMGRTADLWNTTRTHMYSPEGYATIPIVPADVRPAVGNLRDWFVLWEVPKWSDHSAAAPPPRDPYLLRHVAGSLYAIIAEWDLTELERAVMGSLLRDAKQR